VELQERGNHVEVFERMRLLGGRATSYEVAGHEVDNGQHVFLHCCTQFRAFVQRLGMSDALREQERFDALVLARDGKRSRLRAASLPAPLHLLASLGGYRHLDAASRFRVARALARAALERPDASMTFEQWLNRAGQNAATRRTFWDPFFIPAMNAPFDCVSASDALFVIQTAFLSRRDAARFGFSTVPLARISEAAAARLSAVHRSTAVLDMNVTGEAIELRVAGGRTEHFEGVVLAAPPQVVRKLLGDPLAFGVEGLDAYDAYPIVDVHVWHDRGSIGFEFAAALDSPLQWIFEKEPGYLCCSISAAGEYLTMPAEQLERVVWEELVSFLPQLRGGSVLAGFVTRTAEATYLPRPGGRRTRQSTLHPLVAIAGSWTQTGWPDTMESAVRSGLAAAHAIATGERREERSGAEVSGRQHSRV
jgi:squalene-associated FAD-dependent desaturase